METIDDKVDYFRKNPNYTYIFMWAIYLGFFLLWGIASGLLGETHGEEVPRIVRGFIVILMLVFIVPVTLWVLKCKGQHWLWLIPSLISIGAIIPLLLKNKNEIKPVVANEPVYNITAKMQIPESEISDVKNE